MSLAVDVLPLDPLPAVRLLVDLPAGRTWKVVGHAGDAEWIAGEGTSRGSQQVFTDPWAPLGVPVTYDLNAGAPSDPVLRTYRGQHAITDLTGRIVVDFLWEKASPDTWDLDLRSEFLDIPGAELPVHQAAPVAGAGGGGVVARTVGAHTRTLLALAKRNRTLLLLHNARACRLPECDVPDAQTIQLTGAPGELTSRQDRAERRWSLTYRHVRRPWAYLPTVATWDDVKARWDTIADMLADGTTNRDLIVGDWLVEW